MTRISSAPRLRLASCFGVACCAFLLSVCFLLSACSPQADVEIIRAISMLPRQTEYTRDFEQWVERVNELGQGKFRIIFVGGPEALPTFEQADAVRTSVVHLVFGPATYYMGLAPEVEALFASNMPPWETRLNGGMELMDRIHQERLGVRYLARAAFIEFHLFTREQSPLDAEGMPDLSQQRLRGGPVWRDFITSLGAQFVNVAAPDIYMALERNMIQGIGWPIVGLEDASWHQHISYRIDPGVFSSDVGIIFNQRRWEQLPEPVRKLLMSALIEYETSSYRRFEQLTREQDERLRSLGMRVLKLDQAGADKYRKLAHDVIWRRLQQRSPEYYAQLRARFYRDGGALNDAQ